MRTLHYLVVARRELLQKSKALNFRNSLCPFSAAASLYGHENSVMTEKMRMQVQVSKMRSLQKIKGVTLLTKCAFLEIRNSLKPLLPQIESSQLRLLGRVSRMPQEKLPCNLYLPKQLGKIKVDDLKLLQMNQYYIEDLEWNRLGLQPCDLMGLMEDREVW